MIEADLQQAAELAGVPLFGIAIPGQPQHYENYVRWIQAGHHAEMSYLARQDAIWKRENPAHILTDVKSILLFGFPYPKSSERIHSSHSDPVGMVSSYAQGADYHDIIPSFLKEFVKYIESRLGKPFSFRIYTDTGPILERDWGQSSGLGWIGKNTCLISPQIGSFFFLAEVLTDLPLTPTPAFSNDFCGICQRCIEACPTQCISTESRTINAQRCISYLTIENRGIIPPELRSKLATSVFGCDICQSVCPWNNKTPSHNPFPPLKTTDHPVIDLHSVVHYSEDQFRKEFAGSPILRAKRTGLLRNIVCVLGNKKNPESIPHLIQVLENEKDTVIRIHTAWALAQYPDLMVQKALKDALSTEKDTAVRKEMIAGLK